MCIISEVALQRRRKKLVTVESIGGEDQVQESVVSLADPLSTAGGTMRMKQVKKNHYQYVLRMHLLLPLRYISAA